MKTRMAKGILYLLLANLILTAGCGSSSIGMEEETPRLHIVASISILADMMAKVAGERAEVAHIVPLGDNPEDYELLPGDLQRISDADLLFLNGWGLEGAMERSLSHVARDRIVYVTEGVPAIPLVGEDVPDPHAWLDAGRVADYYIRNIKKALTELDPPGEAVYRENAARYLLELQELDDWIREQVKEIPRENRIIVISENALKYYGEAYGLQTEGIWELNSHEEGTPRQISRVVDLVTDAGLPAVFVETTVDSRYMETVSRETGVPIGGKLYTDALGKEGSGAVTYTEMMRYNTEVIVSALKEVLQ